MSSSTFFNGCKIQLLLSLISLASQGSAYLFQPVVTSCMYWDSLPTHHKNDEPYKIHCIQDENGLPGIVNTTWKLVQAGYCPYYDRHGKAIDIRRCNSGSGRCPEETIFSYEAVRYAGCYSSSGHAINYILANGSTVTTREPNTGQSSCECYSTKSQIGIITTVSLLVNAIVILAGYILWFKMKKNCQTENQGMNAMVRRKKFCEARHFDRGTSLTYSSVELRPTGTQYNTKSSFSGDATVEGAIQEVLPPSVGPNLDERS